MSSTRVQNHSSQRSCTNSQTFPDFLGRNRNFVGGNRNFVGDNLKNLPWNRTNEGSFFMKQAVGLCEEAQIARKRAKYLQRVPKISIFKPSENRIISNNFFWIRIWTLNGGGGIVKISILWWRIVRKIHCCFLPKSIISSVNGDNLIVEQFVFVCLSYSGQRRVQKTTRCQQENNNDRKSTSP